jgi:hypothetical protein
VARLGQGAFVSMEPTCCAIPKPHLADWRYALARIGRHSVTTMAEPSRKRKAEHLSPGDLVLDFGKHSGRRIAAVPVPYLRWLCAREVCWDDKLCVSDRTEADAVQWMWTKKPRVIAAARAYVDMSKRCVQCCEPLVPMGHARANGKDHADWSSRRLHKKCWRELQG